MTDEQRHSQEIVTLRDLMEEKFRAIQREDNLLRVTLDAKFEAANQWRDESKMRAMEYVTRAEFTQVLDHIREDVRFLRESRAEQGGKASATSVWINLLLTLAAIALSLAALFK